MTRIAALDCASLTGYAVENSTCEGVKDITPAKNQRPGARYQKLRALLNRILAEHPDLTIIAYENPIPHHSSMMAAELAWGYVAIIKQWCADHEITVRAVHVSEWKKHLTGHGNAEKQEVIDAVKKIGRTPIDHNHADAIGILCFATQTWGYYAKII